MNLTDEEKHDAAMACRAAAFRAEKDAEAASNPTVRAGFEATARRYSELAKKFSTPTASHRREK